MVPSLKSARKVAARANRMVDGLSCLWIGRQKFRDLVWGALAVVEQKVSPPCTRTVKEIRSMVQHFKAVPDFRGRFESYPLWSMLTILFLATLCGAPRGQKDIAKFARGLSQAQRRALGIRRNPQGKYPAPTQPTFCRLLQRVDARKVEEVILAIQEQMRGPAPKDQLIVLDGKEPKHGSGASVLSAVTVPSQRSRRPKDQRDSR